MERIKLTFAPPDVAIERRPDGAVLVRSPYPLGDYPPAVTHWLYHWAEATPERVYLAERWGMDWRRVTYAEALDAARRIAQAILDRGLSPERPVAILSGNSIDHALIGLGAMIAGVPYAPISPPYSLVDKSFAKLRSIIATLTPGLVFVDDGIPFALAIEAAIPVEAEIVAGVNPPNGHRSILLADFMAGPATADVEAAHAKVGPDTIGKFLFTSGSTGTPKGVINTQRMMTANQAMLAAVNPSFGAEPTTLIDWLPWNHTFGGNNNFNLVLRNGGSFHIDAGKPVPKAIHETVQNLQEISPTVYYNVPKGFEMLLPFLEADQGLRKSFFKKLQAFVYAGAALPPHVREAYERLTRETIGEAVPVLTSFGSTETGPSALSVTAKAGAPGVVGIPNPGVVLKLVPNGEKLEARITSPSVTPGYWRQPELTAAAFDEEGYYKFGDALKFVDDSDLERGFMFDGRVAEDFKLATGTWVSVGPLRARFTAHCAPYVTDVVVAGQDRDDATALVIPNLEECRRLAGLNGGSGDMEVLAHPKVLATFSSLLATFNKGAGGSSGRFFRALLMDEPPSLDNGELTDKGSINQRAVLARRTGLIDELYASEPSHRIIR